MKSLYKGDSAKLERAVGRLAIAWAWVEAALELSLIILHRRAEGQPHELPLNLKAKVRFFRSKSKARTDTEFHAEIDEFAGGILQVADDRHWCVHGVIARYDGGATAALRRYRRPNLDALEQKSVSLDDIEDTRLRCTALTSWLVIFPHRFLEEPVTKPVEDLCRQLRIELPR